MKILLVTESYWPNADGGAQFERRLALGLVSRGDEIAVIAPSTGWKRYTEDDTAGKLSYKIYRERAVTFWANTKYKVSFWPFWQVRRIIRAEHPDVLHIHNTYLLGLAGLMWAKIYKIPVLATNHFMPENALLNLRGTSWLYRPLHRAIWWGLVWFHNRCDYVTSPTPTAVALLKQYGLKRPSAAISNGIDTDVFKPGIDTAAIRAKYELPDEPIVIYVGRTDGEKRLDILIDAFAQLHERLTCHLVVAGFGKNLDELKDQAKRQGVAGHVTFTGYLDEADKPALYDTATVFAISSPAELQSIVTLEAMASGLPIVSVDVAALKELCHDGKNGYLFKENDAAMMAEKLEQIIDSPELQAEFGAASLEIIRHSHATGITFEQYDAAYQLTIGEGAKR